MSARWSGDEWSAGDRPRGPLKIRGLGNEGSRPVRSFRPLVSVVAPAHNEVENLPLLVEETVVALRQMTADWGMARFELIIVDDASTDGTRRVLERLAGVYQELRIFTMARQGGQSAALFAGIRVARGDWIATLDADLQNDPRDIARLWGALSGHDAVLGYRRARADVWSKRWTALLANRIRNWVLGQEIRDTGCSLRIFRRKTALSLPMFRGVHRFMGPLLLREGCDLAQIPVEHRRRRHGRSHYGIGNRSLGVVLDLVGVAWLMKRPLRCDFSGVDRNRIKSRRVDSPRNETRAVGLIEG